MNNEEKIQAIRAGMQEDWYQMLVEHLILDREATKDSICIYTGANHYDADGVLVGMGRIEGINFVLNKPEEMIRELNEESKEKEES